MCNLTCKKLCTFQKSKDKLRNGSTPSCASKVLHLVRAVLLACQVVSSAFCRPHVWFLILTPSCASSGLFELGIWQVQVLRVGVYAGLPKSNLIYSNPLNRHRLGAGTANAVHCLENARTRHVAISRDFVHACINCVTRSAEVKLLIGKNTALKGRKQQPFVRVSPFIVAWSKLRRVKVPLFIPATHYNTSSRWEKGAKCQHRSWLECLWPPTGYLRRVLIALFSRVGQGTFWQPSQPPRCPTENECVRSSMCAFRGRNLQRWHVLYFFFTATFMCNAPHTVYRMNFDSGAHSVSWHRVSYQKLSASRSERKLVWWCFSQVLTVTASQVLLL